MIKLDGRTLAKEYEVLLKKKIENSTSPPSLVVVLVGEDPASKAYIRNKMKACERVGIHLHTHNLPHTVSEKKLKELLFSLNEDPKVSGILVQLPLPKSLNKERVLSWINPRKDVDGLCVENMGLMWAGQPRVIPCTPQGVMKILDNYQIPIEGRHIVVVGRSQIVGLPMAYLLQKAHGTVTICHSRTENLSGHTKKADILVVAAGQPHFLGAKDIKEGAVVIDVGIHRKKEGLCGDVRYEELEGLASAATPVPGGVGPMTIAMLLENVHHLHMTQT